MTLQIKQITKDIGEEKEKRITIDKENKKIGSRSKLEKIMNEFRLDLISRIRPILSQRASELFGKTTKSQSEFSFRVSLAQAFRVSLD